MLFLFPFFFAFCCFVGHSFSNFHFLVLNSYKHSSLDCKVAPFKGVCLDLSSVSEYFLPTVAIHFLYYFLKCHFLPFSFLPKTRCVWLWKNSGTIDCNTIHRKNYNNNKVTSYTYISVYIYNYIQGAQINSDLWYREVQISNGDYNIR